MWQEEVEADQLEWRGQVQLLSSGEVRYFREWAGLAPLLLSMLADAADAEAISNTHQQ